MKAIKKAVKKFKADKRQPKVLVSFRCDQDILTALQRNGMSLSYTIRELLRLLIVELKIKL